jgi:hypothetical protein
MAYTKFVSDAVAVSGVCTLTISNTDIEDYYVGDKVRVEGINNTFNGTHTLTGVNLTLLTVTFSKGNATQTLNDLRGAEIYVLPQWTDEAAVLVWLGIDAATANDTAFITECVEAANQWCFRKRQEAGYTKDRVTFPPSGDVQQGTTLYAATLYRERGTSGDMYGSYDGFSNQAQPVTLARIMQLLGCGRAQVA